MYQSHKPGTLRCATKQRSYQRLINKTRSKGQRNQLERAFMTKMGQSVLWKNTYKYLYSIKSVNIPVHNNTKKDETNARELE